MNWHTITGYVILGMIVGGVGYDIFVEVFIGNRFTFSRWIFNESEIHPVIKVIALLTIVCSDAIFSTRFASTLFRWSPRSEADSARRPGAGRMDAGTIAVLLPVVSSITYAVYRSIRWFLKVRDEYQQFQLEHAQWVRRSRIVWTSLCRRGLIKAQMTGLIDTNAVGTARVSDAARELFTQTGLAGEIRAWWRRTWRAKGNDAETDELLMEIEATFGERIVNEICGPLGIFDLECLQMALIIAREEHDRRPNA